MKIILLIIITNIAFAQVSQDVFKIALQNSQMNADSTWVEMEQTIKVSGQTVKSKTKFIKFNGLEKIENQNQFMHQIIVKSDKEIKIKDVKTNQVVTQPIEKNIQSAPGINIDHSWGNGDFKAPIQVDDLWLLESNSNLGDQTLISRKIWMNLESGQIVKMSEFRVDGLVSETNLEYCTECINSNIPRKIIIKGSQNGQKVDTVIEITKLDKIKNLSASFFEL